MDEHRISATDIYSILDASPSHVFVFSEEGKYLQVFGGHENNVGSDCKQYIGLSIFDVLPLEISHQFHSYILKTLRLNQTQCFKYHFNHHHIEVLPFESPTHGDLWIEGILKPHTLGTGERVVIWTATNVTNKHYVEHELKKLTDTDPLTGILNRRAFMTQLMKSIRAFEPKTSKTVFIMLDIDNFKVINDRLGHLKGDEVLKHTIDICEWELRSEDKLGRIGEEFAVILPNTTLEDGLDVANRLCKRIEQTACQIDNELIYITVSIGLSLLQEDEDEPKYVLTRADNAMYKAKRRGKTA